MVTTTTAAGWSHLSRAVLVHVLSFLWIDEVVVTRRLSRVTLCVANDCLAGLPSCLQLPPAQYTDEDEDGDGVTARTVAAVRFSMRHRVALRKLAVGGWGVWDAELIRLIQQSRSTLESLHWYGPEVAMLSAQQEESPLGAIGELLFSLQRLRTLCMPEIHLSTLRTALLLEALPRLAALEVGACDLSCLLAHVPMRERLEELQLHDRTAFRPEHTDGLFGGEAAEAPALPHLRVLSLTINFCPGTWTEQQAGELFARLRSGRRLPALRRLTLQVYGAATLREPIVLPDGLEALRLAGDPLRLAESLRLPKAGVEVSLEYTSAGHSCSASEDCNTIISLPVASLLTTLHLPRRNILLPATLARWARASSPAHQLRCLRELSLTALTLSSVAGLAGELASSLRAVRLEVRCGRPGDLLRLLRAAPRLHSVHLSSHRWADGASAEPADGTVFGVRRLVLECRHSQGYSPRSALSDLTGVHLPWLETLRLIRPPDAFDLAPLLLPARGVLTGLQVHNAPAVWAERGTIDRPRFLRVSGCPGLGWLTESRPGRSCARAWAWPLLLLILGLAILLSAGARVGGLRILM